MKNKKSHTPDMRDLEQVGTGCTCSHLRKAARAVTQLYDEVLRPSGLRATQFTLLAAIRIQEPVPVNHLADSTVMDPTTMSRNLKLLEREGLIAITPGSSDRRRRDVALTRQGARALADAYPLWQGAQEIVSENLGAKRLKTLISGLAATVDAVRE